MKPVQILAISIVVLLITMVISCADKDLIDDIPSDVNPPIELGLITENLFSENGIPKKSKNESDGFRQIIRFSVSKYSRITFAIEIASGEFTLTNTTKNEWRSNDGGSLGGGSNTLRISESLDFVTELDEGEHELVISGLFSQGQETSWELVIEDIEELRPYENLGILNLPFNESFVPNPARSRRTVYDFEIPEDSEWDIKVNRIVTGYHSTEQVLLYHNDEIIVWNDEAVRGLSLQKGKYTLSFDTTTTLILGLNDFGNQDLGEISSFPFSEEFNIDFTYETNNEQRIYFQTTEPTNLIFTNIDSVYLSFSLKKADGTNAISLSGSEILPPGSYYILITPDSFAYGQDEFIYKILKGAFDLELTAAN